MVIGIDASRYRNKDATGVEWYSYHLLNELLPMLGRDHAVRVRLYSPVDFSLDADCPFNVEKRIMPMRRLWTVVRMSWEMLWRKPDVLFVPSHVLPFFVPDKAVITIHDVAFRHFRECYSWKEFWLLHRSAKRAVRKAWRIIVPSEATKEDLVSFYGCDGDKITVIPHGAPDFPRFIKWSDEEKERLLKGLGLVKSDLFILSIGRIEAKKNIIGLLRGFSRFGQDFLGWKLVLAGKPGVGYEEIVAEIEALGLGDRVVITGYIGEAEKIFLLHGCRAVALPSLYEGFGLPILEGFAVRRPVLTSNRSSMPEVAGDAAVLVNPDKPEEIGVALKRLASDSMLVNRLVRAGDERLKDFSWEKAAEATYEVLTAAHRPPPRRGRQGGVSNKSGSAMG